MSLLNLWNLFLSKRMPVQENLCGVKIWDVSLQLRVSRGTRIFHGTLHDCMHKLMKTSSYWYFVLGLHQTLHKDLKYKFSLWMLIKLVQSHSQDGWDFRQYWSLCCSTPVEAGLLWPCCPGLSSDSFCHSCRLCVISELHLSELLRHLLFPQVIDRKIKQCLAQYLT